MCMSWFRPLAAVAVLAALLTSGCATSGRAYRGDRGYKEKGLASWYGPQFHGRRAANGEVYDMNQLTAAHRALPFETVVEVRNQENGRTVRLRITDRGPFVRGRIIDVSYEAARRLEMLGPGVVPVEIRVVTEGARATARGQYWVQAGAFRDPAQAKALYRELRKAYSDVKLSSDGAWSRIRLGPFAKRKQAEKTQRDLQRRGVESFVTQL